MAGRYVLLGIVIAPPIAVFEAGLCQRARLKWFIYAVLMSWLALLWLFGRTIGAWWEPNTEVRRPGNPLLMFFGASSLAFAHQLMGGPEQLNLRNN